MKFKSMYLLPVIWIILLSGCASTPVPVEPELTANEKLTDLLTEGGLITEETERGVVVYLPALFFEYGSADLISDAQDRIRYIADAINQDFALNRNIAIEGHTDSKGSEDYNLELSKKRSISVMDELVFSKVDSDRIEVQWFGETVPLAPNENADGSDNPEGRARNRRVEFIILNPVS